MEFYAPAAKMNGLGNAILIMDMRADKRISNSALAHDKQHILTPTLVRHLAQNPITAFDQIMALYEPKENQPNAPFNVEIWNNDGTQANACGNGTRCLAEYLWQELTPDQQNQAKNFYFSTKGGQITAQRRLDGQVRVNMGQPRFTYQSVALNLAPDDMNYVPLAALLPDTADQFKNFPQTASVLSIGNPHAVFFLPQSADQKDDIAYTANSHAPKGATEHKLDKSSSTTKNMPINNQDTDTDNISKLHRDIKDLNTRENEINALESYNLAAFGQALEKSPIFADGVNVSLAQIVAKNKIILRVYERGAGLTQACGTAACATAIAAYKRGLTQAQSFVVLPGGTLDIAYQDGICYMTGATEYEYDGLIDLQSGVFKKHS